MSKMHPNKNPESSDAPVSIDRRKLLTRGGIAAGGLATFAVGYGETLKNAVKGLVSGTAGEPTEHALRGNSLQPEFLITAQGRSEERRVGKECVSRCRSRGTPKNKKK